MKMLDLLVVGAGPTGIAIGARASTKNLEVLVVDKGPLAASLVDFPTYMTFFTTRDLIEIAGIPMSSPRDKPTRQEALSYYRAVAARYDIPLSLHEEVVGLVKEGDRFRVDGRGDGGTETVRYARTVALAQGYFHRPRRLNVPGENESWVNTRYLEPYRQFDEHVVLIGGGNSAIEAALELWRNHVRVTLVHRGERVKDTVKYWVKPDFENRVAEGSITALFSTTVRSFGEHTVELDTPEGVKKLEADAAYVLIGYDPDTDLGRQVGVKFDPETLVPSFDPDTCESNVDGLFLAGTVQVGRDIGKLFIENSRVHADRIVAEVAHRFGGAGS